MALSPQLNPLRPRSPMSLRSHPRAGQRLSFGGFEQFTFPLLILTFAVATLTCQGVDVNSIDVNVKQVNVRNYTSNSIARGKNSESRSGNDNGSTLMAQKLTDVLIKSTVTPEPSTAGPNPPSLHPTDSPASSRHQTESLSASSPPPLSTSTTPSPPQIRLTTPASSSSHSGLGPVSGSDNVSAQQKRKYGDDSSTSTASETTADRNFPTHEEKEETDHSTPTNASKLGNVSGNGSDINDGGGYYGSAGKSKRHAQEDTLQTDEESYHKTYRACRKAVRKCLDQLPRSPINAIPSTVQDLGNSCRAFENGVNCFNNVSCFEEDHREHLIMHIHAEYEILKFLCYNDSFRVSCLPIPTTMTPTTQAGESRTREEVRYKEVADRWNNCTKTQMMRVNMLHAWKESEDFCCIKITFTECISAGSSDKNEHNTTRYLESMSRTYVELLRRENNLTRTDVEKCAAVKSEACVRGSDNKPNNGNENTHALTDVHLSDDTNTHAAARASQNKRKSMQDQYHYEFEYDEDEDEDDDEDNDEDNDSYHRHYHDRKSAGDNGKAMTKLSSAKNAGGTDGKGTTTGGGTKKKLLSKCSEALEKCIEQIPPMPDAGIPSTLQSVKKACSAFHNGTECVNRATKDCLNEKERQQVHNSILGAHETFTFLCNDDTFRSAYLKHGPCYNKISKHWDNCVRKFISALRQLKDSQKSLEVCCLRMAFLHCVMDVTNRYCDHNATQFMRLLSETLIRSTMHSHTPNQCLTVKRDHCPIVQNSAGRFGRAVGHHEGSSHRFTWILGRVVLSLTMMDLVTVYYTRFIIT